jgi:hypothetical protein
MWGGLWSETTCLRGGMGHAYSDRKYYIYIYIYIYIYMSLRRPLVSVAAWAMPTATESNITKKNDQIRIIMRL